SRDQNDVTEVQMPEPTFWSLPSEKLGTHSTSWLIFRVMVVVTTRSEALSPIALAFYIHKLSRYLSPSPSLFLVGVVRADSTLECLRPSCVCVLVAKNMFTGIHASSIYSRMYPK